MAAKCNKAAGDERSMFKYALRGVSIEPSSELCYEIGMHFYENEDLEEAKMWLYNAAYETEPLLSVKYKDELAVNMLNKLD